MIIKRQRIRNTKETVVKRRNRKRRRNTGIKNKNGRATHVK